MLLADILPNLQPGSIYLTLGTIEQIVWICRKLGKEPEFLYEPSANEIRKALEFPSFSDNAFVIHPKELKGSGIKATTTSEFLLPTDSYFFVNQANFAFISIVELTGEVSDKQSSAAKKIEGGCYRILDLRTIADLPKYPYVALHELEYSKQNFCETNSLSHEQSLVDSLTTIEGVQRWGSFTKGELRKWFVTPGIKEPILLKIARAQGLIPFINPFCHLVEKHWSTNRQSVFLKQFAMWVYCSTEHWNSSGYPGLTRKIATRGEGVNFYFNPSPKAKRKWLTMARLQ